MTYTARHLLFAAILGLLLGALAVNAVRAASRSSAAAIPASEFRPVGTNPHGEPDPQRTTEAPQPAIIIHGGSVLPSTRRPMGIADASDRLGLEWTPGWPPQILDPFPASPPPERAAVEVPAAELVVREKATPRPKVAASGGWHVSVASWYGPGFYGHRTACGQTLTEGLVGVAHKTLACGTAVTFRAGSRVITAPVVDRGPYIAGREWDLTAGLCAALGRCSTGPIEWRL